MDVIYLNSPTNIGLPFIKSYEPLIFLYWSRGAEDKKITTEEEHKTWPVAHCSQGSWAAISAAQKNPSRLSLLK
ncbi:hypothetical protein BGZ46_004222, partial [Entomortierella lignicola]